MASDPPDCICSERWLKALEYKHGKRFSRMVHATMDTQDHETTCPRHCGCVERHRLLRRTVTQPDGHDSACPWYVAPRPPPTREQELRLRLRGRTLMELTLELAVMQDRTNELLERLLAEDVDDE